MRKKIFLSVVIFASMRALCQYSDNPAQRFNFDGEKFHIGIKISPSVTWLRINHNDAQNDGATANFGLGLTGEYQLNEIVSVISSINYKTFGGYVFDSLSLNTSNQRGNYKLKYTDIEIPFGLKFQTLFEDKYSFYIQGGASVGLIITASEHYKSTLPGVTLAENNIMNITHPAFIDIFAGVGAEYKIYNRFRLFAELNLKNTLTSVADGQEYVQKRVHDYSEPIKIYPSGLDLSIGVRF
jgi:hypothetical protein